MVCDINTDPGYSRASDPDTALSGYKDSNITMASCGSLSTPHQYFSSPSPQWLGLTNINVVSDFNTETDICMVLSVPWTLFLLQVRVQAGLPRVGRGMAGQCVVLSCWLFHLLCTHLFTYFYLKLIRI